MIQSFKQSIDTIAIDNKQNTDRHKMIQNHNCKCMVKNSTIEYIRICLNEQLKDVCLLALLLQHLWTKLKIVFEIYSKHSS